MGKGLHLTAIRTQSSLDDRLAIARCHCSRDICFLRHLGIECPQCLNDRLKRRSIVASVRCIKQLFISADSNEFCRCRSSINPNTDSTAIRGKITTFHATAVMPLFECSILRRILKQYKICCSRLCCRSLLSARNTSLHLPHINFMGIIRKRRTECDEIIAVIHIDDICVVELQCLDKTLF